MIAQTLHRGVVVPMTTPFTAEGTVDEAAAERLATRLAAESIGIFVLGTTGETASIKHSERLRLVSAVVRAAEGQVPVYAGISDNCVQHSLEGAERFLAAGATAVVAHLPCYYPLTPEEMFEYFTLLHEQIDGDILLYNIPQTTHMSLPLDMVARLAELPRIIGFKDSERRLERAREAIRRCGRRPDFALFMGSAALALEALRLGFDGLVPSSGNYEPRLWRLLKEAAEAEDWETGGRLQSHLDSINQVFQEDRSLAQSLAALKVGLHLQGVCEPHVLPPIQPIEPEEYERIRAQLSALSALAPQ